MAKKKSNKSRAKKTKNSPKVNNNEQDKAAKLEQGKIEAPLEKILEERVDIDNQTAENSKIAQENLTNGADIKAQDVQEDLEDETKNPNKNFDVNQSDTYDDETSDFLDDEKEPSSEKVNEEIEQQTREDDDGKHLSEKQETLIQEPNAYKDEFSDAEENENLEVQEIEEPETQEIEELKITESEEQVKKDKNIDAKLQQDKAEEKHSSLNFILPTRADRKSEVLRKMLMLTSFVILIVCVVTLVLSTTNPKAQKKTSANSLNSANDFKPVSSKEKKYPKKYNEDYRKLYSANRDTIGILSLDETSIEEPVVKYKDNKYYKYHNFYKEKSKKGATYLDCHCDIDDNLKNTVIYRNNSDEIIDYERIETYNRKPLLTFKTLSEDSGRWKIYACFYTTVDKKDDNGYVFDYAYQKLDKENFKGFIKEINRRRIYITSVDIKDSDKILMVSVPTNNDYFGNFVKKVNTRFVLVARKVRENESEVVTTSKTIYNKEVYKPQAYFDNTRTQNRFLNIKKWNP